jgi:hypothetical protein
MILLSLVHREHRTRILLLTEGGDGLRLRVFQDGASRGTTIRTVPSEHGEYSTFADIRSDVRKTFSSEAGWDELDEEWEGTWAM